ncbi:MAG: hypothetical protein QJR00_06980 [Bacillota bacterium]|nr:hypothetical protein [Bacillota bacterium]
MEIQLVWGGSEQLHGEVLVGPPEHLPPGHEVIPLRFAKAGLRQEGARQEAARALGRALYLRPQAIGLLLPDLGKDLMEAALEGAFLRAFGYQGKLQVAGQWKGLAGAFREAMALSEAQNGARRLGEVPDLWLTLARSKGIELRPQGIYVPPTPGEEKGGGPFLLVVEEGSPCRYTALGVALGWGGYQIPQPLWIVETSDPEEALSRWKGQVAAAIHLTDRYDSQELVGEGVGPFWTSQSFLGDRFLTAAALAGEPVWPLPMPEGKTQGAGGYARHLASLVGVPFLLLDLKALSLKKDLPYHQGVSGWLGVGVRTLLRLGKLWHMGPQEAS